jgi:homospermidine synthase
MGQETFRGHFEGRLLIVGFGSIGKTLLPLIRRHLDVPSARIAVLAADAVPEPLARAAGITFEQLRLTPANFAAVLAARVSAGDALINVSVNVSSLALVEFCARHDVLYVDSSIEPWPGQVDDASLPLAARTNYHIRETVLALKRRLGRTSTAVVDHGANPGLVSHFAKQAIADVATRHERVDGRPRSRAAWAHLAQSVAVRLLQISERDTQTGSVARQPGEFVNTWSIEGFVSEAVQPAELGWGTHEQRLPADARRHEDGCDSAILLARPGAATRVRSWAPAAGAFHGFLISHDEAIAMADYYTVRDADQVIYRPTVMYAYHPSDDALLSIHEFASREWQLQDRKRLLEDEIESGMDELGVLIGTAAHGTYWYGSQLSIERARALVPQGNATTLQVAAGVLSALAWAIAHPRSGVVEPDELDHEFCLDVARPYLGRLVGTSTEWTPLADRHMLFPEAVEPSDPWQFVNVRVAATGCVPAPQRSAAGAPPAVGAGARPGAVVRRRPDAAAKQTRIPMRRERP